MIEKMCRDCSRTFPVYNTASMLCQMCAFNKYAKPSKRISRRGKRTVEYEKWRVEVAIPYLDQKFGRSCAFCQKTNVRLDIDHIKSRGSRPDLKMQLSNVRYLCRPCHILHTDGKL